MIDKARGFGVVEIVIAVVVVALLAGGGWWVWQSQQKVTQAPTSTTQNNDPALEPAKPTTKKYTNTKYGYSFEYPVEAEIHSDIPFGGQSVPITPESDSATVELSGKRFEVLLTGYTTPTQERVYQEFSGTVHPEDIVITDVQVGNATGLKATFKDPALTGSYYFLQKQPGGEVAKITLSAGLENILNSFKFE